MRVTLSDKALDVIGVPVHMRTKSIKDFNTYGKQSLSDVRDYIAEYISDIDSRYAENKGLFLYGSNGVGKTFLASIVAMESYRWRYSTKRVSFADYVQKYTRVWDAVNIEQREELESELYTEYKAVEFLILEEIGKEIDSKIASPVLEDLLRYREDHHLPTVICTNLSIELVEERYGYSITSLIKGNMTPILIEGADKRSKFYVDRTTQ